MPRLDKEREELPLTPIRKLVRLTFLLATHLDNNPRVITNHNPRKFLNFLFIYLFILQFYEASHGDTEASNDADTDEVDDTSMATLMKALEVCALP